MEKLIISSFCNINDTMDLSHKSLNFNHFTSLSKNEKKNLIDKFNIGSIYFAVDGTRRFAMSELKKLGKEFSYDNYYQLMKSTFIRSIKLLFDRGFKTILVLLHDNTSINRGDEYIKNSFKLGIEPLWMDKEYLNFYRQNKVNVSFVGFNEIYKEIGYLEVIDKMDNLSQLTRSADNHKNLLFLTLTSPSEDIMRLTKKAAYKKLTDKPMIIKDFYGFNIPNIDLSLYYGRPRGKVSPPLITDDELRIYTKFPSLYLNDDLVDQILYFTILHKISINDKYKKYSDIFVSKISDKEYAPSLIWGDLSYSSDI